jgi:hypothetical protein
MRLRSLVKCPSPAMLVALAALFVSLSGTTYAVTTLPKRSVGSLQLKKGAVRAEHIAGGAVSASKLSAGLSARVRRNAAAMGMRADVHVARAAYADRAGLADTAALADTATTAGVADTATTAGSASTAATAADAAKLGGKDPSFFLPRSTIVDVPRFSLGHGEQRVMLTHGPFTLTARCQSSPAGDRANVLIATAEPYAAFDGFNNDPDLDPGDPELGRSMIGVDEPHGVAAFESSARGTAVAPDGTEIRSIVFYAGVNLFGLAGDPAKPCTFGGFAIL